MLPDTLEEFNPNDVLVGIDEAGRGPGAFNVCAAAVIWPKNFEPASEEDRCMVDMIKDSKKLTAKRREKLAMFIKKNAVAFSMATVDNDEIDEINILQATFKAMHSALDKLDAPYDRIVVDGNRFKTYIDKNGNFVPHTCVVNGDNVLISIAAASILAKVHRDTEIVRLVESDKSLEPYGWDKNKGYLTKQHVEAIRKYGLTKYHRKSFIHL